MLDEIKPDEDELISLLADADVRRKLQVRFYSAAPGEPAPQHGPAGAVLAIR